MMNDAVKRQIEKMKVYAKNIQSETAMVLEDLEEMENDDDLFLIENKFSSIERCASDGYEVAKNTWDLFEEEA